MFAFVAVIVAMFARFVIEFCAVVFKLPLNSITNLANIATITATNANITNLTGLNNLTASGTVQAGTVSATNATLTQYRDWETDRKSVV